MIEGNLESDKGTGTDYHLQHFHYSGANVIHDTQTVIRMCGEFIENCLKSAAVCVLNGEDGAFSQMAYYFFGRATHCGQDYYAHSNGVAIKHTDPSVVLRASSAPKALKFCTPTGSSGMSQITNVYSSKLSVESYREANSLANGWGYGQLYSFCKRYGVDYGKLSKQDKRYYMLVMMIMSDKAMPHPYMHLDTGGKRLTGKAIADKALKRVVGYGFNVAAEKARTMTALLLQKLKFHLINAPTYSLIPNQKRVNRALQLYRCGAFNRNMHNMTTLARIRAFDNWRQYKGDIIELSTKGQMRGVFDCCLDIPPNSGDVALDRRPESDIVAED